MYYFHGKVNRGHVVCSLYGGGLYLGESVMGGSTALLFRAWCVLTNSRWQRSC